MSYFLPQLKAEIKSQVEQILGVDLAVVEPANPKFGADLAVPTFAFASQLGRNPAELATQLSQELSLDQIAKIEAVSGFVNIWIDSAIMAGRLLNEAAGGNYGHNESMGSEVVLIEHTDANPFKQLHIGHVYSNTIGESIARLHEAAGAEVHRLSYHGDVGPHIARSIYGLNQLLGGKAMDTVPEADRVKFLGEAYALGAKAYKESDEAKAKIDSINQQIYAQNNDEVQQQYELGKSWSFAYFQSVYDRLGSEFEKQYLESQTAEQGLKLVQEHTGKVYEESDGAVIFRGEDFGLHTRVFITQQGLPTYETKDLGLAMAKQEDFPNSTKSIVITGREQQDYFAVMLKSLEQFAPEIAGKTRHLAHGLVRLPSGKMSSRTGDVISAEQLFESVTAAIQARSPESPAIEDNMLGAIKYTFLKQNIGANIIFDIDESVSLEGQTGPYIQYALVRINSVIESVSSEQSGADGYDWQAEHELLRQVAIFPEMVEEAVSSLAPHVIAQYGYALAKDFNRYYESVSIKATQDDKLRGDRLKLLMAVQNTLRQCLSLLNIPTPEKM